MVETYPDLEALSRGAAELFARCAERALSRRGRFTVALAGGSTPKRTYELLAAPPFREGIEWARVEFFWGDERCVSPEDPRSNARMARLALLDRVPVPPSAIHPMECGASPAEAAMRYEELLRSFFAAGRPGFDLVLLGLGEDGHTASLFPETPALEEENRWVLPVHVPEQKMDRITLTAPILNQSGSVVFVVSGASKAEALREVLEGPRDPRRLPAQLIRPENGELYWLADWEAAALRGSRQPRESV
jgi:6-phosphogluconolactonase